MGMNYLHRLLRLFVLILALLLFGWVVTLAMQEEKTPWLVRSFLIAVWLLIVYIGVKALIK
jgi:hypothetical protein